MATINLGRVKPVFRGAYNASTAYVIDDIVTYQNETYIAITATTGNLPTVTSNWTKLAAKGTDGTDVSTTLTTQGDLLYRDGSGLQRLAAGTSGQVLQTGGTGANPSWVDAAGGGVLNVYTKMWGGGKSLSGTQSTFTAVSDYVTANITPTSSSSEFLIVWTLIGTASDHHFFQTRYIDSGGSSHVIGLGRSELLNNADRADTGTYPELSFTNSAPSKTQMYYHAPSTTNVVKYQLYYGAHGGNFYFGRSYRNTSTRDYMGLTTCVVYELDGTKSHITFDNAN